LGDNYDSGSTPMHSPEVYISDENHVNNNPRIGLSVDRFVNHGCIPLLVSALDFASESVQRARAVGNLAVNIDYSDLIINHGAAKRLVASFRSQNSECQRMAAMALSNLSSNLKSHGELLECGILGLVKTECLPSLDPKHISDHETARFCVLCITNLTGSKQSHSLMEDFFGKRNYRYA